MEEISGEEITTLEPVVVTAKRIPSPMLEVGSSISVVTAEDIERRNIKSVHEAVREVAGVDVAQSGGLGKITSVFLRGGNSFHTLVLIDGVQVNSPTTGGYDFGDLLVENIERIEVLRGPQSALYGSEAIGGVVNIITKKGKGKTAFSLLTEFGSFRTFRERIGIIGAEEAFDYAFSISRIDSKGISAASEAQGNGEEDGYKNVTVSNRVGLNLPRDGRVDLTVRYITGENEIDGFGADDPNRTLDRDALYAAIVIKGAVADWWVPSLQLSVADEQLEQDDPDAIFDNSLTETNVQNILLQNELSLLMGNTLLVGVEYDQQQGNRRGSFDEEVETKSVFVEDQAVLFDVLFLTAGVRYDDHSTFGDETTFRGTLAYLIEGWDTKLHASFGTGFRAPSLNELFFPGFSNTDLRAEESHGFDIGFGKEFLMDRSQEAFWFDVTYFHNDFDDLISFPPPTFIPININEAEARGVEFSSGIVVMKDLAINLGYTFMDTEDKATGKQLLRRAKNKGSFAISYGVTDRLDVNLFGTIVEDRIDFGGAEMDDFVKVDIASSYQVTDNLEFIGRIENLFDEDYEEVTGFTSPGFSVFGGVKMKL
ncbi:MAG: TonB-dependent receptor plug domain-containing protein [Nitrospiria bacterium]